MNRGHDWGGGTSIIFGSKDVRLQEKTKHEHGFHGFAARITREDGHRWCRKMSPVSSYSSTAQNGPLYTCRWSFCGVGLVAMIISKAALTA